MVAIARKNTRAFQEKERNQSEAGKKRFLTRKSWFQMEMMRQQANRYQMALDEAYYDGDQWTPDEAAEVRARGQNPVVFNEIKPVVDFMMGTERRARVDFMVTNRTDDSPEAHEDAIAKTKLLKFIDDINQTQFERSNAADDCFKAGLGWVEVGVKADPTEHPIYKRSESWRNMLYDSLGSAKNTQDWRYQFRFREVDLDIAVAMLPGKEDLLQKAVINHDSRSYMQNWNGTPITGMQGLGDMSLTGKWTTYNADAWLNNPRERVLLIECWATEPYSMGIEQGISTEDAIRMRKRAAIMTEYDTLMESWSPFKHDRYPFIPLWCYRRKRDGAPYGVIRQLRGPQDSLNKHMSKAQFRIAARQIMVEDGALDPDIMDIDELEDAAGDPAAVMQFARGALSGGKVLIKEGAQLAEADIMLAERFANNIRTTGPVNGEDRGQDPGQISGKARALRQEQSSRVTAEPFDNMLMARQIEGEITLSLIEQYHTDPMTFAVRGEYKKFDYVKVNQKGPDGKVMNDIAARKASFIIGEAPWQQSLAEAAFESVMAMIGELAKVAPQVVVSILDIVFDLHPSLPKKEQMLRRIRQATGMEDPDAAGTPDGEAQKAKQQQMAAAQFEAEMAKVQAEITEAKAKGEKLSAEAMAKRLEGLYMAAQAAQVLASAPQIAPVADELAKSVGFKDQNGDAVIGAPVPTVAAPAVQPALQTDGARMGIESPAITGIQPGAQQ